MSTATKIIISKTGRALLRYPLQNKGSVFTNEKRDAFHPGILSARRIHGRQLRHERILVLGAGAAGLGVSRQIRSAMHADGLKGDDLKHAAKLESGLSYPSTERLTDVSVAVARAVMLEAMATGLAKPLTAEKIEHRLIDGRWHPDYLHYVCATAE